MKNSHDRKPRPKLLYTDEQGNIYSHPRLEMIGCSGTAPVRPDPEDLTLLPDMSKLFFHPNCPPCGYDPVKKTVVCLAETKIGRRTVKCSAVSAFIQQGWVRLLLPAMDYRKKNYSLPLWAYSTVGLADGKYYVPAFEIDDNFRWSPEQFDDRGLAAAIKERHAEFPGNRLMQHLERCAAEYHCFAAKNFFFRRWEAPIPTSPSCNSQCIGCISLQPDSACLAPQERISFVPGVEEIVAPFVRHLNEAPDPIISFGQGCEGEPIVQWKRISKAIAAIRAETDKGTINLNTNGSVPKWAKAICRSGLDSIRISMNSARKELYDRYYCPQNYCFDDVIESVRIAGDNGVFTMINYLIFPGVTDQDEEVKALIKVIEHARPHLIHFKNLNIDPELYLKTIGTPDKPGIGIKKVKQLLEKEFPSLQFGYYNRTRENFFTDQSQNTGKRPTPR
jgi:molybdenum cofactor biosynthesis enzyme MoaA